MHATGVNATGKIWCMRVQRALARREGRLALTNFVLGMLATMRCISADLERKKIRYEHQVPLPCNPRAKPALDILLASATACYGCN